MKVEQLLHIFYDQNHIPEDGGSTDDTFCLTVFGVNLHLPNPKFRKEALYIHDIQHVLNNCDTSWKGEAFIAGWEIATGMWRYLLLGTLSLWAMGYSLWMYPKQVLQGYKKGLCTHGIIDLKETKSELMRMEFDELVRVTKKKNEVIFMGGIQWVVFLFWSTISQFVFLFPLLVLMLILFIFL